MYSREIDGEVLTLGSSGWTYAYTFVLYDHQTESLWYHLSGTQAQTGIAGARADQVLTELPSAYVAWRDWVAQHPGTKYWGR